MMRPKKQSTRASHQKKAKPVQWSLDASAQIDGACRSTGAGNVNSILAIVPVHVKAKKGNKVVATYAFLDSGSNVTFCTEKLMASLNITGRKTSILLKTIGGERLVSS